MAIFRYNPANLLSEKEVLECIHVRTKGETIKRTVGTFLDLMLLVSQYHIDKF